MCFVDVMVRYYRIHMYYGHTNPKRKINNFIVCVLFIRDRAFSYKLINE